MRGWLSQDISKSRSEVGLWNPIFNHDLTTQMQMLRSDATGGLLSDAASIQCVISQDLGREPI
jgi:hypothetical protein